MSRKPRPHRGLELAPRRDPWFTDTLGKHPGVRRVGRWEHLENMRYPTKCGYNDPLTNALVLCALARIDPAVQLRARQLTGWLTREYPQLVWDSTTVGKVLAVVHEVFEDYFVLPHAQESFNGFLQKVRTQEGGIYFMNDSPVIAAKVLEVIDDLMRLVEVEHARITQRLPQERTESPLYACASIRKYG